MTRTARSTYPRALRKDRSESKSGLDKSIKKNGAGAHSWGSILTDPATGPLDEDEYTSDEAESQDQVSNMSFPTTGNVSNMEGDKKTRDRSASNVSVEDVLNAREFRKRVFSNSDAPVDLSLIARTSVAASNSPLASYSHAVKKEGSVEMSEEDENTSNHSA